MPTINTWISDDDYNKYLVVKQKRKGAWTEFIHEALNGKPVPVASGEIIPFEGKVGGEGYRASLRKGALSPIPPVSIIKEPEDVVEAIKQVFPAAQEVYKTCKIHGTPLTKFDRCTQRGCKYA